MAAATALLALSGMAVVMVGAAYDGTALRNAERAPRDAEVYPTEAVRARYDPAVVADPTGTATVVRLLPPTGAAEFTGPPPPGLPRWPTPGEVWLSPTLAAGRAIGASTPWGELAGYVTPAGLALPSERIGYTRTRGGQASGASFDITGFGVPDPPRALQVGDAHRQASKSYLTALTVFFLVLPALVLVFLTARAQARQRQRQAIVLQALGTPLAAARSLVFGEIAPAAALGSACALIIGLVVSVQNTVPVAGAQVVLTGTDLSPFRAALIAASALAFLVVVASALATPRQSGDREAPRLTVAAQRGRRPLVMVAVIATVVLFLSPGLGLPPLVRLALIIVSAASTLWVLPIVVSTVMSALGRVVARPGTRHGLLLVVGRQGAARPRSVERVALGMVVMIGVAGVAQLYFSAASPPALDAERVEAVMHGSVLEMPLQGRAPAEVGDVVTRLPAGTATIAVRADTSGRGTLTMRCPDLAALGRDCGTAGESVPVQALDARFLAIARWFGDSSLQPRITVARATESPGDATTLLFVRADGSRLPHADVSAAAFQSGLRADTLGKTWIVGAQLFSYQARWVTRLAAVGLCMVVGALTIGASAQLTTTARDVAPVLLLAGRRRSAWVVAAWHQLLPLVLALLVGLSYYAVLSVFFSFDSRGRASSTFAVVCLAGGGVAALVSWAIASVRLSRGSFRSREWLEV